MTKADIVEEIANSTGLTKKDTAHVVDQLIDAVKDALCRGRHIEIRGFGTFKVKQRKSRVARNPRTGDPVQLPREKLPSSRYPRNSRRRLRKSGELPWYVNVPFPSGRIHTPRTRKANPGDIAADPE